MDPTDDRQIVIREEAPEGILSELHALLAETRTNTWSTSVDQLRWKYLRNPDGDAVVWTLRTSGSRKLVGFTACIPRRMCVDGRVMTAWNGADFSIAPQYRTLGPAVLLRRQARLEIDAGRADFLYAHPNARMALIHQRAGHQRLGRMIRLARPLVLSQTLESRVGGALMHRVARVLVDPVLKTVANQRWGRIDRVARLDPLVFDDRFDELFAGQTHIRRIVGVRDSRYLNWRWVENRTTLPTVVYAHDGGRIVGFLVMTEEHETSAIRDLFPANDFDVVNRLIKAAMKIGLDRGHSSISIRLLEGNPLIPMFRKRWFFPRDQPTDSFVYGREAFRAELALDSPDSWYMLSGDRDI